MIRANRFARIALRIARATKGVEIAGGLRGAQENLQQVILQKLPVKFDVQFFHDASHTLIQEYKQLRRPNSLLNKPG